MLSTLIQMARGWAEPDEGVTALEYAVLVTAIVALLLVGATAFGQQLQAFFETLFPL